MNFSKWKYSIIILLVLAGFVYQMLSLYSVEKQVIEDYKKDTVQNIESLLEVSSQNKGKVTEMIYSVLMDEYTLNEFRNGNSMNQVVKNAARKNIYDYLLPLYEEIKKIGVGQMQFHLPNNESFLRFHSPDYYGDSLIDVRDTVNKVISSQQPVSGYEVGRFFGGYRFVYPIVHGSNYLGSVEVSYKMSSVIQPIEKSYGLKGIILIDQDEIEKKSFEDFEYEYKVDASTTLGIYHPKDLTETVKDCLDVDTIYLDRLNQLLIQEVKQNMEEDNVFVYNQMNDTLIWALKIPLYDINDDIIGKIVFYKRDLRLMNLLDNQNRIMNISIVVTLIAIFLLVVSYTLFNNVKNKATYDSLTRLYTRHAFTERVIHKVTRGVCMMIDIDDFKKVNDEYGHTIGDKVLIKIGEILTDHIRKNDFAVRWGGEEFLLVLVDIDIETALKRSTVLLKDVENTRINNIGITISIGLSPINNDYESAIIKADKALYEAKNSGKNKVCLTKE